MKVHHYSPTGKICSICNKPILNEWYDKEEKNGRTETYQERKNDVVHYFCLPNAKTLQQINDERKYAKNRR